MAEHDSTSIPEREERVREAGQVRPHPDDRTSYSDPLVQEPDNTQRTRGGSMGPVHGEPEPPLTDASRNLSDQGGFGAHLVLNDGEETAKDAPADVRPEPDTPD